ncbi:methyltransferase domain-containing protein [Phaeovibrio sulfidiphilus]|uniref:Methyltransferase domain-containing protein n=1 Tax=Phaeovibrio sulfidiphilus TaxID=1220600 RepID=A0A8J6YLT7_9PROT|nr:methyltransferase domain-containing protein [Phaeovibrio sulfidiphilus]MBE1237135.1 methyltransferase domain-containing protein [Phaeovibrio sulfidiphilus]
MTDIATLFDAAAVRRNRERAARAPEGADFLVAEAAERLLDRLDDIRRSFPVALDLGCRWGLLGERRGARGGIGHLVQCDTSPAFCALAGARNPGSPVVCASEEALPFAEQSFDLVISNLSLHAVNDLPGVLVQIRRALKPGGAALISVLGGETLVELRQCFYDAEVSLGRTPSPHVAPVVDVKDLGDLAARAGFTMPTADRDGIEVRYEEPLNLFRDLRQMGEANALVRRSRGGLRRDVLARTLELYREQFAGEDGRVPATFQILTLTAWAPERRVRSQ